MGTNCVTCRDASDWLGFVIDQIHTFLPLVSCRIQINKPKPAVGEIARRCVFLWDLICRNSERSAELAFLEAGEGKPADKPCYLGGEGSHRRAPEVVKEFTARQAAMAGCSFCVNVFPCV